VRWLNDELLIAYMALINQRNEFHMRISNSTSSAPNRPRTYVFNTYFYTRLVASGYDFPGVARWTRRAGVDVAEKELIIVPVNLGNNHWVLAGIDVSRQTFLYLDSMHGRDIVGVVASLKRWFYDEVHEKHGVAAANALGVDAWTVLCNQYVPYRLTKSCAAVESSSPSLRPIVPCRIPVQRDSGSCGVFTAMIADCLEMGIKVFFKHQNIRLIRSRMALNLYRRMLPG
jgi:sentrin-specific protease 1